MTNGKSYLWGAVSVLIALLIGALVSGLAVKAHFKAILDTFKPEVVVEVKHDTIRANKPVSDAPPKIIRDTVKIPLHDTTYIVVADTLFLTKEQREYRDSTYRAWVSGVSPSLDSIEVYQRTKIITQTTSVPVVKKQRLNIGVQAGVGAVQPFGERFSPKLGYYVGLGVQYNF